jgi:hypothetical protein
MKYLLIALLLLGSGCASCGPVFIEAPRVVDITDCPRVYKSFSTQLSGSLIPFPFSGSTHISLYTNKPKSWDTFNGSVFVTDLSWNVGWISKVYLSLGGITIAIWDDNDWRITSTIDLVPHISNHDSDTLVVRPRFRGQGVRPAKSTVIRTEVILAVCGPGADELAAELQLAEHDAELP